MTFVLAKLRQTRTESYNIIMLWGARVFSLRLRRGLLNLFLDVRSSAGMVAILQGEVLMRPLSILKRAAPLFAVAACLAVLANMCGFEVTADAGEYSRRPAPAGGYAPLADAPGRAMSYWERDGQPIDINNPWRTLKTDGHHDPNSDAVNRLQNPVEAMRSLPRSGVGNFVDWVKALKSGQVEPRAEVEVAGQMKRDHIDVTFRNTGPMPTVTFSHTVHTEWLACSNCHDELFKRKAGTTQIRMKDIFEGKACGVCHGQVAFPPDQCLRCHNGPKRRAQN